jgi:hypothetical protein
MNIGRVNIEYMLLLIGTALLPVYVTSSGGLQPSHAILAIFSGIVLFNHGIPFISWSIMLLSIFLFSLLIESFYVIIGGDIKFIINSIFFLYNFLLVCAVYQYVRKNGLSTIALGIMIAAAIALITIINTGVDLRELGESGRATGTFNNPNQLGFFSVCLLSLSYLFYQNGNIRYWIAVGLFSISLFFAISSLSKAAMVANFLVIVFALKPASSTKHLIGWVVGATIGIIVILQLFQSSNFHELLFIERLVNMGNEGDSSLESRGYFVFLDGNALQLFFGLGAQGVDEILGHEVHSTFGSVINNYGFFGFIIFFVSFSIWALRVWQFYGLNGLVCLVGPSILYGITHNGTRFTIFWLLFAASLGAIQRYRRKTEASSIRMGMSSGSFKGNLEGFS